MKKEEINYTEEFKKEILEQHHDGKSIGEIADEYNIEISIVYKWVIDFNKAHERNIDIRKLIPDYVGWEKGRKGFTSFDYVGVTTNYEQILTISKLLFPDVVIVEGCFLLKDSMQWLGFTENWDGCAADIERVYNFICMEYLFVSGTDLEDEYCKEIINILQLSWYMYFNSKFPEYDLIIDVYYDSDDGWCITVYQKNNLTRKQPPMANIIQARERL